jgi:hypothetical protein
VSVAAAAVDASTAALSVCAAGSDELGALFTIDRRTGHTSSFRLGGQGEVFPVGDYPATAALMERGGVAVWRRDMPDIDAQELELLEQWNLLGVLAGAVSSKEGCWLVELFADGQTAELDAVAPALRALMAHAVYAAPAASAINSRVPNPAPPLGV